MARKVSKTPLKRTLSPDQGDGNEHFTAYSEHAAGFEQPDQGGDGGNKGTEPNLSDLLAKIGAMQERMDTLQRTNEALMTSGPSTSGVVTPKAPELGDLPDPVTNPKEYAKAVSDYTQAVRDHDAAIRSQQDAEARERSNRYDALEAEFTSENPEIAEDPDRLRFITNKVVSRAKDRGLDLERYMFTNRRRFFDDLVAEHEKIFGTRKGEDDEGDEDEGRSTSVFGGVESGGRGGRGRPAEDRGDMLKDLQNEQRKLGLF